MKIFIVYFLSYWTLGSFFAFIDLIISQEKSSCIRKYWFQPISRDKMISLYQQCIPLVLRNQVLIQFPLSILFESYYPHFDTEFSFQGIVILLIKSVIIQVLISAIFTVVHGVLHRYLYFIHKTHHVFTRPIAICTEYNSLTEELINWGYTYFSFWLLPLPYFWTLIAIVGLNISGQLGHSGYNIWNPARLHDLHHRFFTVNLSPIPLIDRWNGTFMDQTNLEKRT